LVPLFFQISQKDEKRERGATLWFPFYYFEEQRKNERRFLSHAVVVGVAGKLKKLSLLTSRLRLPGGPVSFRVKAKKNFS
jgi:hypothetical protein